MGTGLLVINSDEHLNSLIEGGTGSFSAVLSQPEIYPDRFESGTLNVPGILSLGEGIRFVVYGSVFFRKELCPSFVI